MPVSMSDSHSSYPSHYHVFREKARGKDNQKLDRQERIELGKQAATVGEIIIRFFQDCFVFFSEGWRRAVEEHENYFDDKSVQIIRTINSNELGKVLKEVQEEAIHGYLSRLEAGKILFCHFDFDEMFSSHQCYQLILEAKQERNHWLHAFADESDLGKEFEHLHALPLEIRNRIVELNKQQRKVLSPSFRFFVKELLGDKKLKDLSDEQVKEIQTCLMLLHLFERKGIEGVEDVKQGFALLKAIEFKTFFFSSSSTLQTLFLRFRQEEATKLLEAKGLVENLNSLKIPLPIDLYFSQSLEEMIQKLKEELPENTHDTRVKRFGKPFAERYKDVPNDKLPEDIKKLEEDFRLCGESKLFKEILEYHLVESALVSGLKIKKFFVDEKTVPRKIANMQAYAFGNERYAVAIYSMQELAKKTREYIHLGIDAKHIQEFQNQGLKQALLREGNTNADFNPNFKENVNPILNKALTQFNKQQYEQAQETWSTDSKDKDYLPEFVKESKRIAGTKDFYPAINGGEHYRAKFIHRQLLLEKMFFHLNLKDLAEKYGEVFLSHVVDYLFSELEKNKNSDLQQLKKNWQGLLHSLKELQEEVSAEFSTENGDANELFKQSWQAYVKSSHDSQPSHPHPPIIAGGTNGFTLTPAAITEFKASLKLKNTKDYLKELKGTHGELFSTCVEEYLNEHEQEIMNGNQHHSTSALLKKPFEQQLEELKAYVLGSFDSTLLSQKMILSLFHSSSPDQFKLMSKNLSHLEILFGTELEKYKYEEDKKLAQESFHLFITATQLLEVPIEEQLEKEAKAAFQAIGSMIPFCKQAKKAYSPEILAKTFFSLSEKNKDPSIPLDKKLEELTKTTKLGLGTFHFFCFNNHVKKIGEQEVLNHSDYQEHQIVGLIEQLLGKFYTKDQLPTKIESVNELVKLVLSLSSLTHDVNMIKEVLSEQKIELSIEKINNSKNINFIELKRVVTEEIKHRIKPKKEERWLSRIKNNPFSLVHAFLPRFIVKFAHPVDLAAQKKAQNDISEALNPLEAHYNDSSWVAEGGRIFSPLLNLLFKNQKEIQEAKKLISDQVQRFTQFDLSEFTTIKEGNDSLLTQQDQLRRELKDSSRSKLGEIAWDITAKIIDTIRDIDEAHRSEIIVSPQAKEKTKRKLPPLVLAALPKELSSLIKLITAEGTSFFYDILPTLLACSKNEKITKILTNWVRGNSDLITSGINKILPLVISAIVDEIVNGLEVKSEAKEQIKAILNHPAIVQNFIAMITGLLNNHHFGDYLKYLEKLNKILQGRHRPTERECYELRVETIKMIQNILKEMTQYASLLEDSFNEISN